MHATGDIDGVPKSNIGAEGAAGGCWNHILGLIAQDGLDGVALRNIGDAGEGTRRKGSQGGFAREWRERWEAQSRMGRVGGLEIGSRRGVGRPSQGSRRRLGPQLGGCCCGGHGDLGRGQLGPYFPIGDDSQRACLICLHPTPQPHPANRGATSGGEILACATQSRRTSSKFQQVPLLVAPVD